MDYVRVNAPRMVHETVDGEVIVIDLATGAYYSLPGTASEVWQAITVGGSRDQIAARVTGRYGHESALIRGVVDGFLDQLLAEELVVVDETKPASAAPAEDVNNRPVAPFAEPVMEKYTDMAELILLDPVHDVSALGWPDAPSNRSSTP
jgi:hypothetical protein